MDNLFFDADKCIRLYSNSTNKGRLYMKRRILKLRTGHYMMALDLQEYDKQSMQMIFNILPAELVHWFEKLNTDLWTITVNPKKPKLDYENKVINMLTLRTVKQLSLYENSTKESGKVFLDFVKEVVANGDEAMYQYLLSWIANVSQGNKNTTALYLKSPVQGIGKSTFTECIKYIIGESIAQKGTVPLIKTPNNKALSTMLVCYFEELQSFSTSEWIGISSVLKDMITSNHLRYSEKYEKSFEAPNFTNYIIPTNNESIQDKQGRRWVCLDVSLARKGDFKYFEKINCEMGKQEVRDYLLAYFQAIDVAKFNPQEYPETQSKIDARSDRLPLDLQFLKENYVLKNKNLTIPVAKLYNEYVYFCDKLKKKPDSKIAFTRALTTYNVNHVRQAQGFVYNIKHDRLKKIFETNGYLHELDEYLDDDEDESAHDLDSGIEDTLVNVLSLTKRNKELEEKVKELELIISQFKTKPTIVKKFVKCQKNEYKAKSVKPLEEKEVEHIEDIDFASDLDECEDDSKDSTPKRKTTLKF